MKFDTPLEITEWDWFKIQADLRALKRRGKAITISYEFDETSGAVTCGFYFSSINPDFPKDKLLEEFKKWIYYERLEIGEILKRLPLMSAKFDMTKDIVFQFLDDYGTGAAIICKLRGDNVEWSPGYK